MTHHFALTMAFESSLRSINPKITMPYWDFTIEGEEILDVSGDPDMLFDISPFFNATWFGSSNDEHHIADGRVEVGRWKADAGVGEGAMWSADRATAWRMSDGEIGEAISLAEAARIAERVGLPVPGASA